MTCRTKLSKSVDRWWRSRRGVNGVEYALLIGLIAVGLLTVISKLGGGLSRISCGVANVFGSVAAIALNDGGNSHPCVYQDTCTGAAVGSICYRSNANGGFDAVVVAQVNTLYAWPSDESNPLTWNNTSGNYTVTGITSTTNGMSNTNALLALNDLGSPYLAATACRAHGPDWYLPAQGELNTILTATGSSGVIGSLSFNVSNIAPGGIYWSSTEASNTVADDGFYAGGWQQDKYGKSAYIAVRCVRN